MKKMMSLARLGVYKVWLALALCFGVPIAFIVLASWGTEEGIFVVMLLGFIVAIALVIFGLIASIPLFRLKKSIRLQESEFGSDIESEWEDPQQITKKFYKTKNWMLSTYSGSIFAVHKKAIEKVEEDVYYQQGIRYSVIFIFLNNKKKRKLMLAKRNDFEVIMNELERWFAGAEERISVDSMMNETTQTTRLSSVVTRKEYSEPTRPESLSKFIGFIVCGIALVALFGFGYSWLINQKVQPTSNTVATLIKETEDIQRKDLLKTLEKVEASEDELEITINSSENEYYAFVMNNTDYFFNGKLNLYNGDEILGTMDCVMLTPKDFSVVLAAEPFSKKADSYEIVNGEFYSLPLAQTRFDYELLYNFDEEEEWYDVLLSFASENEEAAIEIATAEYYKNVILDQVYETIYFYDDSAMLVDEEDPYSGYQKSSSLYASVLDTKAKEISLYEVVDGQETLLKTMSMAK